LPTNVQQRTRQINIVPGQRFSCTDCGRCCTLNWDIEVKPERAARIRKSPLFEEKKKQGYTPLKLVNGSSFLGRKDDGRCVFLDDGRCSYHARHGERAKPATCQIYPFQMVDTPDGTWVSFSFACPAVLAGLGEPGESYGEWLEDILQETNSDVGQVRCDDSVTLSERVSKNWEFYLQLERSLLISLNTDRPTPVLCNAACHLLTLTEQADCVDLTAPSPILGEVLNLMELFFHQSLAFLEHGTDTEKRAAFFERLVSGEEPYSQRFGVNLSPPSGRESPNLLVSSALQRYCFNQVLGKRLLAGPSMATRLLLLATATGLVEYLVEILDEEEPDLHFSFDHLDRAFSALESDLVSHSNSLLEIFQEYERASQKFADLAT